MDELKREEATIITEEYEGFEDVKEKKSRMSLYGAGCWDKSYTRDTKFGSIP